MTPNRKQKGETSLSFYNELTELTYLVTFGQQIHLTTLHWNPDNATDATQEKPTRI